METRFMTAAFSGTRIERNTRTSRMNAPEHHGGDDDGQVAHDQGREVDQGRRAAPDVGGEAGAGRGLVEVDAELVDQRLGGGVVRCRSSG